MLLNCMDSIFHPRKSERKLKRVGVVLTMSKQKLLRMGSKQTMSESLDFNIDETLQKLLERGNIKDVERHILNRKENSDSTVIKLILAQRKKIEEFEKKSRAVQTAPPPTDQKTSQMKEQITSLQKQLKEAKEQAALERNLNVHLEKEMDKLREENHELIVSYMTLQTQLKDLVRVWENQYQRSILINDDEDEEEN